MQVIRNEKGGLTRVRKFRSLCENKVKEGNFAKIFKTF